MKKLYTTPSIEKISFRYRDQVVAASGDGNTSDSENGGFDFGDLLVALFGAVGVNGCERIPDYL